VRFVAKSSPEPALATHYADAVDAENRIVVLSQPPGQRCAVMGGLIAKRLSVRNAAGVIVGGRIRDVAELESIGLGVWTMGRSTVATGAEAKAVEVGGEVEVQGVKVKQGDVVFADGEGVVVVPKEKVADVCERVGKRVEADRKVMEAVAAGMEMGEAVRLFRK